MTLRRDYFVEVATMSVVFLPGSQAELYSFGLPNQFKSSFKMLMLMLKVAS